MPSPYGIATFCDDVRHEVDGKMTYVGVCGPELIVGVTAPINLPKFVVIIDLCVPFGFKYDKVKIGISIKKKSEVVNIFEVEPDDVQHEWGEQSLLRIGSIVQFAPLKLEENCLIKPVAYFDDLELELGGLRVSFPTEDVAAQ